AGFQAVIDPGRRKNSPWPSTKNLFLRSLTIVGLCEIARRVPLTLRVINGEAPLPPVVLSASVALLGGAPLQLYRYWLTARRTSASMGMTRAAPIRRSSGQEEAATAADGNTEANRNDTNGRDRRARSRRGRCYGARVGSDSDLHFD